MGPDAGLAGNLRPAFRGEQPRAGAADRAARSAAAPRTRSGLGPHRLVDHGGAPASPGEVSYGASKNAVESYTVAAAAQPAPLGISANVLCPPATDTGWISAEVAAELARATPPLRVAQPDEAAEAIVFLASHQARCISGQRIVMR